MERSATERFFALNFLKYAAVQKNRCALFLHSGFRTAAMKKMILMAMAIAAMMLSGCSGNKAEELFDTAKLEELQNNPKHAGQLYQEIIEKYPESDYAEKAKQRLSELETKK